MNANNTTTTAPYNPSMGHIYPLTVTISTFILAIFGVVGNFLIILAIITTKELKNRCQFLIGYLAAADLVASVYYVTLRIYIFNFMYFMSNYQCFMLSCYGLYAMNVQSGLTAILGFDRLLAIAAPHKYRTWDAKKYLFICFIPPNIYALVVTFYGYFDSSNILLVAVCQPPTAYGNNSKYLWIWSNCVIAIVVLFVYGAAQVLFRKSHKNIHNDLVTKGMKRILATLTIVMLVYASTWAFTMLMTSLSSTWLKGTTAEKIIPYYLAYPVIINSSSNFLIYAWRAMEFRHAFIRLLGLQKFLKKLKVIKPMPSQIQTPRGEMRIIRTTTEKSSRSVA